MALNTAEELINDIRLGRMVVLMDDEDRENEGDLVIAAECVTPQDINFMATHARGLICLPMSKERCERLNLPLMVENNVSGFGTKFTVSIEAAEGVTTGISAADRAHTVRTAVARNAKAEDIAQPGHIFPLIANPGGVLSRAGHTEAACDLARLAGFDAAGVICEVMNDDGTMARRPDLEEFAKLHDLKIGTIADLIHYRVLNEKTIKVVENGTVQTDHGEFNLHTFQDTTEGRVHLALSKGDINASEETLVRVQVASSVRDMLGAQLPSRDAGWNIGRCIKRVSEAGTGVIVLLGATETEADILHDAKMALGISSGPKVNTSESDETYFTVGIGSQILRELGVGKIKLMGAPLKYNAISGFDLEVVGYEDV
jgi:3,4-dihydroxy 2-butanone 4-phosphate synthase/GTP cyclohydrolase II